MTPARIINVVKDAPTLAQTAAQRMLNRIETTEGPVSICLTGGSTPKRLYELLGSPQWRDRIPWHRVHWFFGDDRFVPQDDPSSNMGMARHAFLDACAPSRNAHFIRTDSGTPDEAARLYEDDLRAFQRGRGEVPLFDLILLGVGPDGHTASLFPGYPAGDEKKLWVVGVPEAHVAPFVPRVSLTLPCLCSSREMLFLAAGEDKKSILTRVFSGEDLPAGKAHAEYGETLWLIDKAAAPENLTDHAQAR